MTSEKHHSADNGTREPRETIQQLTELKVGRAVHLFLLFCGLGCVLFLVWAGFGTLDIVSMVQGEVIPSTKVKRVDHLEGGIVRHILVQEGDVVTAGQALIELEEIEAGAGVGELQVRIHSLTADAARLQAEAKGLAEPEFPSELLEAAPDTAERALELFHMRKDRLEGELAAQREQLKQLNQDIKRIIARLKNSRTSLKLLGREISISEDLLKDQLTTELQHIKLQREATELRSRIEEDKATLAKAEASLQEGNLEYDKIVRDFREQAAEELKQVRRELDEFGSRREKYDDSLLRTVIRAPTAGTVKSLYVHNPGEVVQPAETVATIVPGSDRLVIEAHLPLQDIGYVDVGKEASVKLASRDAARFGRLKGTVTAVSPDSFTTSEGRAYYTIRVETERDFFESSSGDRYTLYPGMPVTAYIRTGERTVLRYLLSPFLDSLSTAMTER